ncbi:MAG: ABC transporter permease [Lachnospiraceae bacterium]|jgi:putative efflux ABC transporter, permease protein
MIYPFENDTRAVVKRISNRSIAANRKRNLFTIVTIALAAALLLAIMLYGFGTSQATINRTKDTAQIVFTNITQEQGDKLYEQDQIDWIGEFTLVSTEQVNNSTFYLQYGNEEMFKAQGMTYSGNIPVSANEIMLQKSFLKELGYGTELGQTISIPLADGNTIEFILSGIINVEMGDIGSYMGMVSKEYANQQYGGTSSLDYYVGLKNAENMSEKDATDYANELAKSLNISDEQVIVRSDYFVTMERGLFSSDMYLYLLIGAVTFVGSGIVIYSIFYISVAENIRSYGQLRTIGTTKKQIRKIVYLEGKKLALIGIPFGLILGNLVGYFIIPNGWNWLTSLIMTVVVGAFAFVITMFSIRTPVKKASLVSPIEATRYTTYQGGAKESNKLHRTISPLALAKVNLLRNKRKFLLTIISLSIGGVLLVTVSTLMVSYNGAAEVRGKSFPFGEYQLELNENDDISLSQLQAQNIFNDDFVNEITALDGVSGIKRWYSIDAVCNVNGSRVKNVQGYSKDEVSALEANLLEGTVDYDTLVSQYGVVLLQDRADDGYCSASLGDVVEIEYTNAAGENVTETFTVMGIVSNYQYAGNKKCFTMPVTLMNDIMQTDCTDILEIRTESEKTAAVESSLLEIVDKNPGLSIYTFQESLNYYTYQQQFMNSVMLIVAICIACFSLINLINTTLTNFLSRRQEIGILQAIGLSKKQLAQMLRYEGVIYALITIVFTVCVGSGLGVLCVNAIRAANPYYFYEFPWLVVLGYLVFLIFMQVILTAFMLNSLKKYSLVDQIRVTE